MARSANEVSDDVPVEPKRILRLLRVRRRRRARAVRHHTVCCPDSDCVGGHGVGHNGGLRCVNCGRCGRDCRHPPGGPPPDGAGRSVPTKEHGPKDVAEPQVPMTLWDAWPLAAPSVRAPAAEQEVAPPDEAGGTYCPRSAGAAMTAPRRARTHTIRLRCFVRMIHIASTSCFRLFGRALNSDTRASTSSSSMALAPCVSTRSAARSRVDAGACWSSMIFSTEETAAPAACCNRAVPCPNASRRAFR